MNPAQMNSEQRRRLQQALLEADMRDQDEFEKPWKEWEMKRTGKAGEPGEGKGKGKTHETREEFEARRALEMRNWEKESLRLRKNHTTRSDLPFGRKARERSKESSRRRAKERAKVVGSPENPENP